MRLIGPLTGLLCPVAVAVACGSPVPSTSTPATNTPNTVTIRNFMFRPATITVAPGAKITVRNNDSTAHTATVSDKLFDTGPIDQNATAIFTAPTKPGSYTYICDIHQFMQGTLVVK
ncbi:MAG TPA: cupredoxin domain-containing protein [Pseudonocardiaceae bacterium]|nr:cupredoxin domain-containing protein [Pseudonocardiaceae bacterium]